MCAVELNPLGKIKHYITKQSGREKKQTVKGKLKEKTDSHD